MSGEYQAYDAKFYCCQDVIVFNVKKNIVYAKNHFKDNLPNVLKVAEGKEEIYYDDPWLKRQCEQSFEGVTHGLFDWLGVKSEDQK